MNLADWLFCKMNSRYSAFWAAISQPTSWYILMGHKDVLDVSQYPWFPHSLLSIFDQKRGISGNVREKRWDSTGTYVSGSRSGVWDVGGYKAESAKGCIRWSRRQKVVHSACLYILLCTRLVNIDSDFKWLQTMLQWKSPSVESSTITKSGWAEDGKWSTAWAEDVDHSERLLLSKREHLLCICLLNECSHVRTLMVANDRNLPGIKWEFIGSCRKPW